MNTSTKHVQQILSNAVGLMNSGRLQDALTLAQRGVSQFPNQPELLHLLGYLYLQGGVYAQAIEHIRSALNIRPDDHEALNNLATAQIKLGQASQALHTVASANQLKPNHYPYLKTQALCLLSAEQPEKAIALLDNATCRAQNDVQRLKLLGDAHRQLSATSETAIDCYLKAIAAMPNYAAARNNLALIYKAQGQPEKALSQLLAVDQTRQPNVEVMYNLGTTYFELGQAGKAIDVLKQTVTLAPNYAEAHESLNHLIWQMGQEELFGNSYRNVFASGKPVTPELVRSFVKACISVKRYDEASTYLSKLPADHHTELLQAELNSAKGDYLAAIQSLKKLQVDRPPYSPAAMDLLSVYMRAGDGDAAQVLLDKLLKQSPNNQYLWAIQSVLWRNAGDQRYHWLCDFDNFVREFTIEPLSSYATLEQFMAELDALVSGLHKTQVEPIGQTLQHGSQLPGRFFSRPEPVIQTLKMQIEQAIERYLAGLPADQSHPFLARNSGKVQFSGSWSIKLNDAGFHISHVHPEGWISASFYVTVPSDLKDGAGDICFGRSPFLFSGADTVEKQVRPCSGLLVLFPSYIWHETIPFSASADDYRLTTPFDVVPG